MANLCNRHNLTTEQVSALLDLVNARIAAARKDDKVTDLQLAELYDLQRVLGSLGGSSSTPAKVKRTPRTRKGNATTTDTTEPKDETQPEA